jgi:hypothetical protein
LISAALILQCIRRSPVSYTVWQYSDSLDSIRPEIFALDFPREVSIILFVFSYLMLKVEMITY